MERTQVKHRVSSPSLHYLLLKFDRYDNLEEVLDLKGLLMININIRSLRSKFEQIELLLNEEEVKVLNLSESWLNADIPNNLVRIDHYKIYRQDRKLKRRGGGNSARMCMNLLR